MKNSLINCFVSLITLNFFVIFMFISVSSFLLGMKRVGYSERPKAFDWLDGTNVGNTYNNFAPGEPNNNQGNEDCGVVYTKSGFWRSEQCSARPYICQRPAGTKLISFYFGKR